MSPNSSLVSSTEERNTKSEFHKDNKIQLTWQYGQGDYEEKKEVCLLLYICLFTFTKHKQTCFQYLTYDGNDFVADFGGYLGLLLGHSLLTFYDYFVLMIERMSEAKCRTK